MSFLNEALGRIVGAAVSPLATASTLHRATVSPAAGGRVQATYADESVDAVLGAVTERMEAGEAVADSVVGIYVLQVAPDGTDVARVGSDDEITFRGIRYRVIAPVVEDGGGAYWAFRARPLGGG